MLHAAGDRVGRVRERHIPGGTKGPNGGTEGDRAHRVEQLHVSRYRRGESSTLSSVEIEPVDSELPPAEGADRRLHWRGPIIVAMAVAACAVVLYATNRNGRRWCSTKPIDDRSASRGDYVATGIATYPTASCRFRVPARFDVKPDPVTAGISITAFDVRYGMGFDVFGREAAGGPGKARLSVIEPKTGEYYTSTFGFPVLRAPELLNMPVGSADAVPDVSAATSSRFATRLRFGGSS